MIKVSILSVGKTRETWLELALEEYLKRLSPYMNIDFKWVKDDAQLVEAVNKEGEVLCLDPEGELFTSEAFSKRIQEEWEKRGARLAFVIGGPDGLPDSLKKSYPLISFSPMTFTHQITRLILVEQLYRAQMILEGRPYHK